MLPDEEKSQKIDPDYVDTGDREYMRKEANKIRMREYRARERAERDKVMNALMSKTTMDVEEYELLQKLERAKCLSRERSRRHREKRKQRKNSHFTIAIWIFSRIFLVN